MRARCAIHRPGEAVKLRQRGLLDSEHNVRWLERLVSRGAGLRASGESAHSLASKYLFELAHVVDASVAGLHENLHAVLSHQLCNCLWRERASSLPNSRRILTPDAKDDGPNVLLKSQTTQTTSNYHENAKEQEPEAQLSGDYVAGGSRVIVGGDRAQDRRRPTWC